MTRNLRYEVRFEGVWGFVLYNGDQKICDSWSQNGFPMAKDRDSQWQREECERVAREALRECEEIWDSLDKLAGV